MTDTALTNCKTEEVGILDSGERTCFETGAVRDIDYTKGCCELMPLDEVAKLVARDDDDQDSILANLESFKSTQDTDYILNAIEEFVDKQGISMETAMLEVSIHFKQGAEKYGPANWQKGIPCRSYLNSAVRHYLKVLRGDTDERHDRAFIWNLLCLLWTLENKPDMNDLECLMY